MLQYDITISLFCFVWITEHHPYTVSGVSTTFQSIFFHITLMKYKNVKCTIFCGSISSCITLHNSIWNILSNHFYVFEGTSIKLYHSEPEKKNNIFYKTFVIREDEESLLFFALILWMIIFVTSGFPTQQYHGILTDFSSDYRNWIIPKMNLKSLQVLLWNILNTKSRISKESVNNDTSIKKKKCSKLVRFFVLFYILYSDISMELIEKAWTKRLHLLMLF